MSTVPFMEFVSSVFVTKEIGLVKYQLVITFDCFVSNFQKFIYIFNLNVLIFKWFDQLTVLLVAGLDWLNSEVAMATSLIS